MHGGPAGGQGSALAAAAAAVAAKAPARRGKPSSIGVPPSLSAEQRDQVLAVLLSKERVLELLIERTFPGGLPPGAASGHDTLRALLEKPRKGGWTGVDTERVVREFLASQKASGR